MHSSVWFLFAAVVSISVEVLPASFDSEAQLTEWLHSTYEENATQLCFKQVSAEWAYNTDVDNADKQQELVTVSLEAAEIEKQYWNEYFRDIDVDNVTQEEVQREIIKLKVLGDSALSPEKLESLTNAISDMTNIYSVAKVCPFTEQNCNLSTSGLSLEPGIEEVISSSTNYDELLYFWTAWRNASGAKMRDHYKTYVALGNEAAEENGYEDRGALWRSQFESDEFISEMDDLWQQIEPLYSELHKYVSAKLKQRFGDSIDLEDGLIPAHVLGNMWAQSWENLKSLVTPFPNASSVDVTAEMVAQNYTPLKIFETSDEFYQSMGLESNAISYNVSEGAMIEKPTDGREVLCHASAWDFCDGQNYRIKMCTGVNYEDFITVHHEMGHIQYFLLYKDQPIAHRDGANPGFHEAIGDTIALSVSTPKHLEKIGLLKNYVETDESAINALMDIALERLAFLPFGLLIDKWRWDVFSGNVTESEWNSRWWYYRNFYQKIKAPVPRSENDFDPGAKYHVAGDSQYISYFVSHVLQFQLYKSLCIAAGQYDPNNTTVPLHKCDFYESKEAGALFREGLSLGSSKHWKDTLEILTGERSLNASAIIEYFQPLYDYLREENNNDGGDDGGDDDNGGSKIGQTAIVCMMVALLSAVLR